MKMVTKMMVAMLAVLGASCSLVAANQQNATEDIAAFEAGLQAIAAKPKLMSAKLLSATSGTTVYPTSNSDMNKTGNHTTPLDLYFDVTMASVSSATLYLNAYDVDYPSATEDDEVYFNGTPIGRLQGYDGGMNLNTFNLPANIVKIGSNHVHIDVSVNPSGWITQIREGTKLVLNGEEGRVTLTVSKDLLNKIELNWSANYSGAAPYNIYRGKTSDNLTIYREGLTVTSFTDTDIVPGDTYYYQIKTMSGVSSTIEEAKSDKSDVAVIASQDFYHKVRLEWEAHWCDGPYVVYRGNTVEEVLDSQRRKTIATNVEQQYYEDDEKSVEGGRTYYYQVFASDGTRSSVVDGKSLRAEVDEVVATHNRSDGIRVSWHCVLSGRKYMLYRSDSENGHYNPCFNEKVARYDFVDTKVQVGQSYWYYVESDLGVKSFRVVGSKTKTFRAPKFNFKIAGGIEVQPEAVGRSGESNVLLAGSTVTCVVDFQDIGENCQITGFQLEGLSVSGNLVKRCYNHVIHCNRENGETLTGLYPGSDMVNGYVIADRINSDKRFSFGARLNAGVGYHGKYSWRLKCEYTIDGHSSYEMVGGIAKNVYFDKLGRDRGYRHEPNWFVYWRDDGACPGMRSSRIVYKDTGDEYGGWYPETGKIVIGKESAGLVGKPFTVVHPDSGAVITFDKHEKDDRWTFGIYNVQDTLSHELQHEKTYERYCQQRALGKPDSDLGVGERSCFIKVDGTDDSAPSGVYGVCRATGSVDQVEVCDSIVDDDEISPSTWVGGLNIAGLKKNDVDTYNMRSVKKEYWEYGGYGDDEFVARVAGQKGMEKAEWSHDWAYPGEQAGNMPLQARLGYQEPQRSRKDAGVRVSRSGALSISGSAVSENIEIVVHSVSSRAMRNADVVSSVDYEIGLTVSSAQPIMLSGTLVDGNGRVVAVASTEIDESVNRAALTFDGKEIFNAKHYGMLTLGCVELKIKDRGSVRVVGSLYDFKLDPIQINREELARVPGEILDPVAIVRVENDLKATIPVKCNIAGEYELVGELSDTNGNYVARARVSQAMAVGTNEVALTFAGAEIYNSAHDGPYVLSSVQLWSGDEMIDAATDLLTTEVAYSYEDFKPADTVVTVDRESAAFASPAVLSDGALGALTFSFDVNNESEESLCYRLAATLDGATGETVAMQNGKYVYLEPGVNHIEVTFSASAIAEKGIDGPYMMGLIELVHQDDLGNDLSFRPTVATEAYKASDFAAAAVAFSNEPSAKGVLECDTPTVVLPFEAKRACTVVASATLIGTNGEFIARASATNRCDAAGVQTAEIVFPREALVAAGQQGPFSVGYFALLPLVDGEEPIYSDTFEVTGVEWIDWEGMFDWVFEGGTAQAALYKGTNGVVRVPSFVKGRDVISVGPCCFLDCECVAEIILPEGIAEVGIGAFFGTSLSSVELPESVVTVDNAAFNVEGLELVVFDGPPPMSAPDAYPKGAVGTYSAAYAAAWEAELKGGCLWNGLTMVPEGADADGYRTESGWTVVGPDDATACEGKRTFRSAETADGASSAMTMGVEEQTSVSFWWKTSCEGARMDDWQGDHAEFLIDGVVVERIAGESCWKQVVVNISDPGQHELSWRYVKDGSGASGSDCVWVSDVGFATAAGEMTYAELLAEADYNWFYENGPVECGGETPFEYIPEKQLPERTLAQIDILCDLGIRSVVDIEDAEVSDSAQTAFCRCANGEGLDFAVWTADGWMRVGNALVGAQQGEARVTICLDYSVTPSQFACKVNNHTLTNENGQSSFVCAKQDCRVTEIATDGDGAGRIVAWAGRYDASNSEILEIAEGTEAECVSDLSNLPRETFQVSGGGTLVIKGADVPTTGVKARLHVDQNSALRFDYSAFSLLPSVLTLFSGVGNDFMLGGNVSIVVPGEGTDRLSKLCVKDGNLEAHIAERPEIVTESGSESPFAIDDEKGSAHLNVGNAVEGFWYGLLTTGSLTTDFMLDRDSVRQCTSSGVLKLESSANLDSDTGFYRVSVSTDEP